MRSPETGFSVNIQTTYRDGLSDDRFLKGWYWQMQIGPQPDDYGPLHGPHGSEELAKADAREFIADELRRLSGYAPLRHIKQ